MTVRLVSSVEIVRIAKTAGFDAIYIDLEHSAFSIETTGQISVMALEAGVPALVRVPARTPEYISRVLDGGALGVIAPGVSSVAEAEQVVAAAKYPPLGKRGLSTGLAHLGFRSVPAAEALPKMNHATMVIVQLESAAGLAAIEDIVAVAEVREAYERSIAACRKHRKHVGVGGLSSRPDLVQQYVAMGARFVSTGTDLGFLLAACSERAKQVRALKL